MGQSFRVRQIVDRDEFQIFVVERRPQHIAPDASESIDANLYCHVSSEGICKKAKLEPVQKLCRKEIMLAGK